jgi:O-antigen ligase
VQAFDQCLTVLLLLFVLLQPVSIAGAFIAYSGAALAWLARLALVGDGQLRRSPLDLPILIYWLLCAVSAVVSPLPASAWEGMRKVNLIFLVILVAHNVPNLRRAKQLVVALFLATLFSVAYAGWQLAAGVGLRVNNLKPASALLRAGMRADDVILRVDNRLIRNPDEFSNYLRSKNRDESVRLLVVRDMGFDVLKDAVPLVLPAAAFVGTNNELKVKVGTEHLARARAFYSHPVSYAMVLESLGCLAFGIWLAFRNHSSPTASFGLLGLWLILGLALVATVTRSAWVNFAFGCLLLVWLHERRRWVRVALPVLLILAAVGTNTAMHHWRGVGLVDLHDPGSDYRVQMWRDGLRLIETHPWFGLGMSTVRDAWWKFDLAAYTKYGLRSHFHSTPIQLAVEQGLPVLVAWTILMGSYWLVLIRLVRQAREQRNLLVYGLALGILGGTSAFLASSLVQYNFGDSVVVLQFWFLAGLALALVRQLQMGADSNDFTG